MNRTSSTQPASALLLGLCLLLGLGLLCLTGCKPADQPPDPDAPPTVTADSVIAGFAELEKDEATTPTTLLDYLEQSGAPLSAEQLTDLVERIEARQQLFLISFSDRFTTSRVIDAFGEENLSLDLINRPDAYSDDRLRELVAETIQNGLKITASEGNLFPIIDYRRFAGFAARLTPEARDYYALQQMESDAPGATDAGLLIGWRNVLDRALAAEAFLQTWPDSPHRDIIQQRYNFYLAASLNGLPNTPLFDMVTHDMQQDAIGVYEKALAQPTDTPFRKLFKSFMELVIANGYQQTKEVKAFQEKYPHDPLG